MIYLQLNNGYEMPTIGYGTWQGLKERKENFEEILNAALEAGYRHIDTAFNYGNEHLIGNVLQKWMSSGKVKREELFIVTKLPMRGNRPSGVEKYLMQSLERLQLDYVDMYLIHGPMGFSEKYGSMESYLKTEDKISLIDMTTDHIAIWKEMEKQVDTGKTKSIGLSNFNRRQIDRIVQNCRIKPSNLQTELHVYLQEKELVEYCRSQGIVITSFYPLGSPERMKLYGKPIILENSEVEKIAQKYGKSPAQVLLRYLIQQKISVIPKSTSLIRLKENIEVFDFELEWEDILRFRQLDQGESGRLLKLHEHFEGVENHPEYPY